jgi:hypothetical protein
LKVRVKHQTERNIRVSGGLLPVPVTRSQHHKTIARSLIRQKSTTSRLFNIATIKLIKLIKQAQYHELDLLGLLNSYGLIWLDCIHSSKQIKLIKRACLLPTMPAGKGMITVLSNSQIINVLLQQHMHSVKI